MEPGDFNPSELAGTLSKLGEEWADLDAEASLWEETKKSRRAKAFTKYMATAKTVAVAEAMADKDEEYQQHLADMVEKRKKATKARVRYDAYRVQIELVRSQESTMRAQMNMR